MKMETRAHTRSKSILEEVTYKQVAGKRVDWLNMYGPCPHVHILQFYLDTNPYPDIICVRLCLQLLSQCQKCTTMTCIVPFGDNCKAICCGLNILKKDINRFYRRYV